MVVRPAWALSLPTQPSSQVLGRTALALCLCLSLCVCVSPYLRVSFYCGSLHSNSSNGASALEAGAHRASGADATAPTLFSRSASQQDCVWERLASGRGVQGLHTRASTSVARSQVNWSTARGVRRWQVVPPSLRETRSELAPAGLPRGAG
jgi:hypothetical protein